MFENHQKCLILNIGIFILSYLDFTLLVALKVIFSFQLLQKETFSKSVVHSEFCYDFFQTP